MKIIPLSLGFKKLNNNTLEYPKFKINKSPDNEFELEFDTKYFDKKDIKVSIVPINCDHEVLWSVEAKGSGINIFFGILSDIGHNNGLWFIEILNEAKPFKILSDINKKIDDKAMVRRWFTLIPNSADFDGLLKISASRL